MKKNIDNQLHNEILEIFKFFHVLCENNNLTYYAIGGTCLGAIRHNGFIPWDDDLDVAMPIKDYLRLRELMNKTNHEKYKLVDYFDNTRNYKSTFFLKIENVDTTFVEEKEINDPDSYKGVFIDIMPMCGCPKNKIKKNLLILNIYLCKKINVFKKVKFSKINNLKNKFLYLFLNPIISLLFKDENSIFKALEKLATTYDISEKNDILFPWRIPLRNPYSNVFPFEIFSGTIEKKFEDTCIYLPIKYDTYLTTDFNNYMEIPPKSKQINHKPAILDFNKSYENYREQNK